MTDVLLIGDTLRVPELRHEVPVEIGDPFLYAEVGGRRVAIVWSVEGDRIAQAGAGIELVPSETFPYDDLVRAGVDVYTIFPTLCVRMVRSLGLRRALVPSGFPLGIAEALRADGVELVVDQRFFDDRRRVKSARELAGILAAQRAAEAGIAAIAGILRRSRAGDGGRVVDGEPLTCELLQAVAIAAFGDQGCRCDGLIVAHGAQAANGHETGSGRVCNDDIVLCDVFPRHLASGCFADMTRTFRVGAVDDTLSAWHGLCVEALDLAVSLIHPGVEGGDVYRAVCELFAAHGQPTRLDRPEGDVLRDGFFHALGHGIGLEVHEAPSLGRAGLPLVAGDVVALEPGLYRFGWGGVRLEDLVLVTDDGCRVLTDYPYGLEP
jgi:Xaa-Pro aminopeptidase